MSRRRPVLVGALSVLVVIVCAVAIARTRGGPAEVEAQGTLHPGTTAAPATLGTAPPTVPARQLETTTTTAAPIAPTVPPPTTRPPVTAPPTTARPAPTTEAPAPPPTADAAPATEAPAPDPFRLTIGRIGVDAPIVEVGVEPGTNALQIPDLDHVGWYRFGSLPGAPTGTAALVGHVDGDGRPGVFARLRDLAPGDELTVTLPDGSSQGFAVTGVQQFHKQALPADLFTRGGAPRLALITCGGPFDSATGHYLDNVVVVGAAI